jgi:autotransporter-associated beta strand protein
MNGRLSLLISLLATLVLVALPGQTALGANTVYTWDASGTHPAAPTDGSGTWNTSSAYWTTGGASDVAFGNSTTSQANIGTNNGAAGTISVSGTVTLNKIAFSAPGSGNYTLGGSGTLSFGGTTPTISIGGTSSAHQTATLNTILGETAADTGVTFTGLSGSYSFITLGGANTFSGTATIGQITVSFNNLQNGGVASSFGQGANTVPVVLGDNSSFTEINYTGPGGSTDRPWTVNGTSPSNTLNNNGTGAISFNNTGAMAGGTAGNRGLTLGGSYAASANTFSEKIADMSSGATSLTKAGAGRWALTGDNTFSGSVNLNGGWLQANAAETPGTSGPLGKGGAILFGGGALQYSPVNAYDYSPRFTNAANQSYSVDLAGQTVTWANPLTSSNGTLTVNSSAAGGKLLLAATNTYTGDTTVLGGILSVSSDGNLGAAATGNIVLDGGTLSAATNFTLNASRTVFLGPASDGGGALEVAGGATLTFGGTIADNGTGPGSLTKTGTGTLALSSSSWSTYTGGTTISAGTVAISGYGTIGTVSNLTIASGATLNVSSATGGYTLGTGQTLVTGNGTSFVNGKLYLGSAALTLFWTNGVPSLTISGNKLVVDNNVTTVAVAGSAPLPVGVYKMISKGTGGSVSGVVSNSPVNVTGAGAAAGASLQITSGELYLNIHGGGATSTTLSSSAATQTYGNAVTFTASVSPTNATGIVTFTDGTTTYGTAVLTNGQAVFTAGPSVLQAGVYSMTASYSGDATHAPSVSSIVTQTINQAVLTVAANNVSRWLGNANPTLTVSYIGFMNGETTSVLTGAPGLATSATPTSPIGNYPIFITPGTLTNVTGNYALVFTNGALSVVARSMPYPQGTTFPLMLYEVDDAPSAANVAPYGWNITQDYGNTTNSLINSYLQLASADSLGGDVAIPCGGDVTTNFEEWPQPEVAAWIQGSMTNNNIGWWDMPEEMRSWIPAEVQLLKDYRAWVQLYDTNGPRPTYEYTPNDRIPTDQLGVVSNVDLIGTSAYCEAEGQPHAWVRYKVAQSGVYAVTLAGATIGSNYLAGQKTVVAVLYLADPGNGLLATPQQSYHDVWSAIASGAQGIAVFSYWHGVNDNPALTNNLNQFNLAAAQISGSEIGQVVLYGAHDTNVGFTITAGPTNTDSFQPGDGTTWQYPSLNVLCETWSNNVYVIAVNSTSNSVSAIITNLPATTGSATLPFELRSLPVSGNSFADTFPPWGAHVYKMAAAAAASPPVISSIALAGGMVTLSCTGASGGSYVLQGSTNLSNPAGWLNLNTNTASGAGLFSFTKSASATLEFYRLRQQ